VALKVYGFPSPGASNKNFVEVEKMEKIERIRKGNIWLNVFKTDDGQILATVKKTYLDKNGQWQQTPFLNPRRGDIRNLVDAVEEFRQFEKMVNAGGQR
jgi:hypothetical protein